MTVTLGFFGVRAMRLAGRLCILLAAFSLSACKEELYTGLSEKEGNEMLSVLLEAGIEADKIPQAKGQLVDLAVERSQLARAISVLKSRGYPRDEFASVGQLFKKDGLISSPLEERARYIYARSQEISATLSQLDGVITARVHVVVPNAEDKKVAANSTASVFIKHANNVKLDEFVPQIKMLVNNGIEGLNYDNISVALFPTQTQSQQAAASWVSFMSIKVSEDSVGKLQALVGGLVASMVLSGLFLLAYTRVKRRNTALATTD